MKQAKFPKGWDEEKIQRVIRYYEDQSDEEAIKVYKRKVSFQSSRSSATPFSVSKSGKMRKAHENTPLSHGKSPIKDKPKTRHR